MPDGGRESQRYGDFLAQPAVDAGLAELVRGQHVVFGLDQLRELGLTRAAVSRRAVTGRLYRIHHAVYSLVPRELLTREGLYMAAVLACGPGAALSHRSAARLHGLRNVGYTRVEVTVPGRSTRTHSGVAVHRSTTLTATDITTVENIPVTTIARTLLDLGEVITQRQLERAFDQVDSLQALDGRAINDQLARNSTRAGAKAVRHVLATHYIGSSPTENEFEEALLALTRSLGLPDPTAQYYIDPGDGDPPIRADFA
jgi:predicted transcriptional regulator of viral defense system